MLALWHRSSTMAQVLSLMATHSKDRSQFRLSEWNKTRYTQVPLNKITYTHGITDQKEHIRMHALSCKEKRIRFGNLMFGPWYLVRHIWTYGFGPWYCIQSVEPMYWVPSIGSLWFWTMVWVRPKSIKREVDHLARDKPNYWISYEEQDREYCHWVMVHN